MKFKRIVQRGRTRTEDGGSGRSSANVAALLCSSQTENLHVAVSSSLILSCSLENFGMAVTTPTCTAQV